MAAHGGGKDAVADEDDERDGHEDRAELGHAHEAAWAVRRDELRQERKEEDRQLRVEDIDENAEPITGVAHRRGDHHDDAVPLARNALHAM